MPRILALDYGLKRTGIAVTDPMQMIASGLTTVETHTLMEWLKAYCLKEQIERFVIGLPLREDGSRTSMSEAIEVFIQKLETAFPLIPVTRQSERHSSQEAARVIFAAGVKKKQRQEKGLTDKVAAAIILQEYMQAVVWK
jgi:putative holliday junction resolvase